MVVWAESGTDRKLRPMTGQRRGERILAAFLLGVLSCAGDGTGLDRFGNPLGVDVPGLGPTLSSIQANILTPICTQCHTGAAAPLGLRFDDGASWAELVGVPSIEMPEMKLVQPGDPESSYLVWKIEGRAEIAGGQMPLALAALSTAEIQAIRDWIANGAEDD